MSRATTPNAVQGVAVGDFVYILEGEEEGSWGIVRHIDGSGFHVAIANGSDAPRLYDRDQLRRPRAQEKKLRAFGIA